MITHETLPQTTRILIVDDHPLVREGIALRSLAQPNLAVVGEAADVEEALRQMEALRPHLVIVDISLKQGSGLDLIKEINARYPGTKTLVSSMHDDTLYAERALRAGAQGYVNKKEAAEVILKAIREVLDGKIYLSSPMTDRLLNASLGRSTTERNPVESLSDRELEVLTLIGQGISTREIGNRLKLSVHTIETYREKIKLKLNLKDAAELWHYAVQWSLEQTK